MSPCWNEHHDDVYGERLEAERSHAAACPLCTFIAVFPMAAIVGGIEGAVDNTASLLSSLALLCFISPICLLFFAGFKGEAESDANRLTLALNIECANIHG